MDYINSTLISLTIIQIQILILTMHKARYLGMHIHSMNTNITRLSCKSKRLETTQILNWEVGNKLCYTVEDWKQVMI